MKPMSGTSKVHSKTFFVALALSVPIPAFATCSDGVDARFLELATQSDPVQAEKQAQSLCASEGGAAESKRAENGRIQSVSCVGESGPEGTSVSWYPNGQVASAGHFTSADGKTQLCGEWTRYFENGELKDQGRWIEGVPANVWRRRERVGEEIQVENFPRRFYRGHEWSLLLGSNLLLDTNGTQGGTKSPVPGLSAAARYGYRIWRWLGADLGLGTHVFMDKFTDATGERLHASVNPFATVGLFWIGLEGALRIGIQGGALMTLDVAPGTGSPVHPLFFVTAQYAAFQWPGGHDGFFEFASGPPPIGLPYMAVVSLGYRF